MSTNDTSGRKLFTLETANALLPSLIPILEQLKEDHAALEETRRKFGIYATIMREKGFLVEGHRMEAAIAEQVERLRTGIKQIIDRGVEIKSLEWGLIDFPALRNGRVVYLCWRLGEGPIAYWHDLDTGFAGRQLIDTDDAAFT